MCDRVIISQLQMCRDFPCGIVNANRISTGVVTFPGAAQETQARGDFCSLGWNQSRDAQDPREGGHREARGSVAASESPISGVAESTNKTRREQQRSRLTYAGSAGTGKASRKTRQNAARHNVTALPAHKLAAGSRSRAGRRLRL